MTYKNSDPGVEKDSIQVGNKVATYFEIEIKRLIDNRYYHKDWTVLSIELRQAAIDEILRIFNVKLVQMKQAEASNNYKYRAQDETYPELKEDLKNWV